jgi:hypothetical protein
MTAELVDLDDIVPLRRLLIAIDKIEALSTKLADERDEMQARLSAAALLLRHAIAAATDALDGYDHCQPSIVHDGVVEALAHLRTLQRVLAGTQPEREAPSRKRNRRN